MTYAAVAAIHFFLLLGLYKFCDGQIDNNTFLQN